MLAISLFPFSKFRILKFTCTNRVLHGNGQGSSREFPLYGMETTLSKKTLVAEARTLQAVAAYFMEQETVHTFVDPLWQVSSYYNVE